MVEANAAREVKTYHKMCAITIDAASGNGGGSWKVCWKGFAMAFIRMTIDRSDTHATVNCDRSDTARRQIFSAIPLAGASADDAEASIWASNRHRELATPAGEARSVARRSHRAPSRACALGGLRGVGSAPSWKVLETGWKMVGRSVGIRVGNQLEMIIL